MEINNMNKETMQSLKKEEDNRGLIDDLKTSIRHLEIELDYEESQPRINYKYIKKIEKEINEKYEKLDLLYETY
jgi:hypothetical protein